MASDYIGVGMSHPNFCVVRLETRIQNKTEIVPAFPITQLCA